ncbi:MafB-like protein [Lysinibacillus mangiferihumi]|uniref:MafB-like protein n=1 Tax=Lysinibacillus mangiferihumi TaxID=1130819 RepID=A0A4U2Z0V7_9BACI|nr:SAR2788 family putative toxin [Lysinibacillus mangiferihumi]TKI67726.1 MafB-like protein [Lysinibacillus mangiferihumi]
MMKKFLIKLIVITMLISLVPSVDPLKSYANDEANTIEYNTIEVENEILQELGIDDTEQLDLHVEEDNDLVTVYTDINTTDVHVSTIIYYDTITDSILLYGTVEEDGEKISHEYEVIVHTNEGQDFLATFVDQSTGDIYDIDTLEAQSSALPFVIIAAVARYGISYAITRYGKKAVTNAIRSKSFDKVLPSVARLGSNKRHHIMAAKHDWHKVTKNNWDDIAKVISHVMRYGKEGPYGLFAREKTLMLDGNKITVTFVRENGKIHISNAWVNK